MLHNHYTLPRTYLRKRESAVAMKLMPLLRSFFRTSAFLISVVLIGLLFLPSLLFKSDRVQHWRLRIFAMWSRKILKIFGVSVQIDQTVRPKNPLPRMIVANHVSYLDIPVIASLGPTLFLAKSEVASWPLIGWVTSSLGMLFVKRARLKDRANAITKISEKLKAGYSVTVFPEGTTSVTGPQLGRVPYYAGAFRAARDAQTEVEVLYLEYSPEERAAWIGTAPFFSHLWNLLGGPSINVKIRREILPALQAREHQVQSYFWSRSWLLEGGHGFMNARSLSFSNPQMKHLLYRIKTPINHRSNHNLRELDS